MKARNSALLLSSLLALSAVSAPAPPPDGKGKFYWTGAAGLDVAAAGNWLFNAPTVEAGGVQASTAPLNNDNSAQMAFTENSPANKRPNAFANRTANKILFEGTTGWSLGTGGSTIGAKEINADSGCSGVVCTFLSQINIGNVSFNLPAGATFVLSGGSYVNYTATVTGGGTVRFTSANGGWNGARVVSIEGDSTAVFDSATVGGAGARLASRHAKLRIKTTVAAVTALFGKTADNSNGIANTFDAVNYELAATDLGDGYVEVCLNRVYIPGDAPIAITGEASGVGFTAATLNGTVFDLGTSACTAAFRYGTDPDDLSATLDLGGQDAAGAVAAALSGLAPDTTYYFQLTATNESGTDASEIVSSFTTRGAPAFGPVSFSGDVVGGLSASCELVDAGFGGATVSCLFGTDPDALLAVESWTPAQGDTLTAGIASGLSFGTTYYVAFQGTCTDPGTGLAYTGTTAPVSLTTARDFTWTGLGGSTAWALDANWDPAQIPTANANAFFTSGDADVLASGDVALSTLAVNGGAHASLDFSGNGLRVDDTLTLAGSGSSLALADGDFFFGGSIAANTLGKGTLAVGPGASVVCEGNAAFGSKNSNYTGNTVRLEDGASFELTYGMLTLATAPDGWTDAGNSVYVPTGAVMTIGSATVSVPGNQVVVDGGRLVTTGTYTNGERGNNNSANGAVLRVDNGGSFSAAALKCSSWYASKVLVLNGATAAVKGAVTIGTDADSGAGSQLVVSNATLTAGSIAIPSDDRHRSETMRVFQDEGATTSVAVSGNVQVAVPTSSRGGNFNHDNTLDIAGGTFAVGGELTVGAAHATHTNNWLKVSRASTRLTAAKLTTRGDCGLAFTVPAGGFAEAPVAVSGAAVLAGTTRLSVDCTAFVQAGGGTTTLLAAGTLADDSIPPENISVITVTDGVARVRQTGNAIVLHAYQPATTLVVK